MVAVHRRAVRLALVACGVIVLAAGVAAQKGKGKPGATPVTTGLPGLDSTYSIRGDSNGALVFYGSDVKSIIDTASDCCQDWEFTTSPRTILLDLSHQVAGSAPGGAAPSPPFEIGVVQASMVTQCFDVDPTYTSYLTMYYGEVRLCPMSVAFNYQGGSWRLQGEGDHDPSDGAVFWARVTCTQHSGSACTAWQIDSIDATPTGDGSTIRAKLWKFLKGNRTEDHGDFNLSFFIQVTNP